MEAAANCAITAGVCQEDADVLLKVMMSKLCQHRVNCTHTFELLVGLIIIIHSFAVNICEAVLCE